MVCEQIDGPLYLPSIHYIDQVLVGEISPQPILENMILVEIGSWNPKERGDNYRNEV